MICLVSCFSINTIVLRSNGKLLCIRFLFPFYRSEGWFPSVSSWDDNAAFGSAPIPDTYNRVDTISSFWIPYPFLYFDSEKTLWFPDDIYFKFLSQIVETFVDKVFIVASEENIVHVYDYYCQGRSLSFVENATICRKLLKFHIHNFFL